MGGRKSFVVPIVTVSTVLFVKLRVRRWKIVHEKYRAKSAHDMRTVIVAQFAQAQSANPDLTNSLLAKAQEDLSPIVVKGLLERI